MASTAVTAAESVGTQPAPGGCYGVQVLVVGRQKRWRDEIAMQIRNTGFQATACDRGVDAMTVLALGLPVDVMIVDVSLHGSLCCAQLVVEARALRPSLRIVLASDPVDEGEQAATGMVPDALMVRRDHFQNEVVVSTVRGALAGRAA